MTPLDEDRAMLVRLRSMWERRDPVPDGLVDEVLARLATDRLDEEYELLTLVASTERLAGVRGAAESRTLTFASGDVTVMVRISSLGGGRARLDGWVTPPAVYEARLHRTDQPDDVRGVTSTPNGRFEIPDVPPGTVTLRLHAAPTGTPSAGAPGPTEGPDGAVAPLWLTTPPFTL